MSRRPQNERTPIETLAERFRTGSNSVGEERSLHLLVRKLRGRDPHASTGRFSLSVHRFRFCRLSRLRPSGALDELMTRRRTECFERPQL
jgi:hypothetical protein